jgi:hypothetical protein
MVGPAETVKTDFLPVKEEGLGEIPRGGHRDRLWGSRTSSSLPRGPQGDWLVRGDDRLKTGMRRAGCGRVGSGGGAGGGSDGRGREVGVDVPGFADWRWWRSAVDSVSCNPALCSRFRGLALDARGFVD